ncbi:MAG: metal-sensitive transcriptional regulator [Phycisphaeraceae bacterium]|nr:metal-sensitive transcriptional regulator [Phycisphaeraceae bacterium]
MEHPPKTATVSKPAKPVEVLPPDPEQLHTCACGPGAKAFGVDPGLKASNLRHLRRIEGQVRGIARMVEDDRYCTDVITQIAAARQSLHSVARNLLANHLKHCAAAAMREPGQAQEAMTKELLDLVSKLSK